jgi:hypothetical protein
MSEGILSQISIAKEETKGTAVTPTNSIAILPSDGVSIEQESVGVEGINSQPALNKDFVSGKREYNGSFEMNAYPNALGYILESALGGSTSAVFGTETTVFQHEFTEEVTKPSYTLEQKIGTITERYAGFTVSSFNLELNVGEPLKLSFTGKPLGMENGTAISPVYETTKVFEWKDIASLTIGGEDVKCAVESINVEYNNNLNVFHGLCGVEPTQTYIENSTVEGSIKAFLTDDIKDLKQTFLNKDNVEIVISLVQSRTIGNASNNTLQITLPRVNLNTYTHPIDTSYVAVESDIIGAQHETDGLIKIKLINEVEEY